MPLASTLDLIGDRWTLLVIRDLVLGKNHFEEFLHSPENIASNILPDRLKRLIDSTLVKKHLINKMDERLYTNSHQKAELLRPLMKAITQWRQINISKTDTAID